MANVENVEEMVGSREAETAAVVTESGGAVATESGGVATTDDETVATAGDEMVGTTREAADGDRVRRGRDGDETGDETSGPRDETGDKTAATAGDERDGSDRWGNVYGRREVRI